MLVSWSTRVKNFLKTGKVNPYEQVKNLLLENIGENELESAVLSLAQEEREQLLKECWESLTDTNKQIIVKSIYQTNWKKLIIDYSELKEAEQIKRLELLGYISNPEVISFLLEEMKSKREGIRLSACGALKRQDPELVLEPILKALTQPDQWLPSRVFEILQGLGSDLDQQLLRVIEGREERVQEVIIQILGEIGNSSCIPVFEKLYPRAGPLLRQRMAEALEKLKCPESWPLLVKLLDDERWQTRMQSVKTLGQLGQNRLLPYLENRLKVEEDQLVRECIDDAIALLEESSFQIVKSWIRQG
jgi:HEAT repeat protein